MTGDAALILIVEDEPPIRRLLLVASAVMNLGLSHQPLSITGVGLLTLAAAVAVAKLLPLVVLGSALRSKEPL